MVSMSGFLARNSSASATSATSALMVFPLESSSGGQLGQAAIDGRDQPVDLVRGRRRAHQSHVVERRDDEATIEQMEMDRQLHPVMHGGLRFGAVARPLGRAHELGARADVRYVPR